MNMNKHYSGLKMKCFEMPNASYTDRYVQGALKNRSYEVIGRKLF